MEVFLSLIINLSTACECCECWTGEAGNFLFFMGHTKNIWKTWKRRIRQKIPVSSELLSPLKTWWLGCSAARTELPPFNSPNFLFFLSVRAAMKFSWFPFGDTHSHRYCNRKCLISRTGNDHLIGLCHWSGGRLEGKNFTSGLWGRLSRPAWIL